MGSSLCWQTNFHSHQKVELPEVLYEEVVEVDERVIPYQEHCKMNIEAPVLEGTTQEKVSSSFFDKIVTSVAVWLHILFNYLFKFACICLSSYY